MFAPPLILPFNSAHLIESAKNSTDVSLGHSLVRRISEAKQKPIVSTTRKRSTTKGDRHGQTCYSLGAVIEDPAKLSDFYEKVFAWKSQHYPEMNYRVVETGREGGLQGGSMQPRHEERWPGK